MTNQEKETLFTVLRAILYLKRNIRDKLKNESAMDGGKIVNPSAAIHFLAS